jgi:hypothetical protein
VEVGNFVCAELIRFEFHCREDQDQHRLDFSSTIEKLSGDDPVDMRNRLPNICKATDRADLRITDLLRRVRLAHTPGQTLNAAA